MRAKSKSNQLQTNNRHSNNNNTNNKGKLIENNNNSIYYYYCSETGKTDNRHKRSREQSMPWRSRPSGGGVQVKDAAKFCVLFYATVFVSVSGSKCVRSCVWLRVRVYEYVCNLHRQMQVKHKSCYGLAWKYATLRRLPQGKGGRLCVCVAKCM